MKHFPGFIFLFLILVTSTTVAQPYFPAQGYVFNDSIIPRIDVFMDPDSLGVMNNDLYTEHEYPGTFVFTNGTSIDTLYNIGIRIRGNTSQSAAKKSFKIDFNQFVSGRKFHGLEKLHLNGEHNDPCVTRSKLYWEILESMKVPGPRANHVDFYINGTYYGLYVNVEVIDENFVKSRFGNNDGNLYKCLWPADLNYISNDPNAYKLEVNDRRVYDLQTNTDQDDYSDLATFISMLKFTSDNDFPVAIDKQFDVNSFLRAYAVDVATGNWDDYMYNENNYYLYHNSQTGRFEFIPYDTDNTFGIDWFGIDWGTKNIYSWYNNSLNLALIQRIFAVPEYVSRFTFFTEQLQAGMFDTSMVFPKIDSILLKIEASAQADIYRTLDYGWTYNDFLNSYTEPVGFQVKYGLKPYFTRRHDETQSQLVPVNVVPVISNINHFPQSIFAGDSISISAWVEDESTPANVTLNYKVNNGLLNTVTMFDDGLHHDGLAGDEIYGVTIPPANVFDTIFYFISATDISAQTGRAPMAGYNTLIITPIPHLFINEIMASNATSVADPFGEYDDWLEIFNADSFPVFLGNSYLSDDTAKPDKWKLPDETISAHGFALFWCDEQSYEGSYHTNFKLSASGEQVMLYEKTTMFNTLLDSVFFTQQTTDVSIGYYPDGTAPIITLEGPTPGYSNLSVNVGPVNSDLISVRVLPNPFHDNFKISISVKQEEHFSIEIMNLFGQKVYAYETANLLPGDYTYHVTALGFANGLYLLRVSAMNQTTPFTFAQKLLKN